MDSRALSTVHRIAFDVHITIDVHVLEFMEQKRSVQNDNSPQMATNGHHFDIYGVAEAQMDVNFDLTGQADTLFDMLPFRLLDLIGAEVFQMAGVLPT